MWRCHGVDLVGPGLQEVAVWRCHGVDPVGPGLQEAATLLMIFMVIRFAWCSCSCHFEVKIIFELQAIKKANIRKLSTAHLLPGRAGRFLRVQQGFVNQRPLDGVQGKPDSCVPRTPCPTCLPECPAPGDQSPLPLPCHLSRAQVLCRVCGSPCYHAVVSTRVPCVCVSARVCSRVHVCASVSACVCACMRASMFLTFWLLSQSICPAESQGPAREPPCRWGSSHPTRASPSPDLKATSSLWKEAALGPEPREGVSFSLPCISLQLVLPTS